MAEDNYFELVGCNVSKITKFSDVNKVFDSQNSYFSYVLPIFTVIQIEKKVLIYLPNENKT